MNFADLVKLVLGLEMWIQSCEVFNIKVDHANLLLRLEYLFDAIEETNTVTLTHFEVLMYDRLRLRCEQNIALVKGQMAAGMSCYLIRGVASLNTETLRRSIQLTYEEKMYFGLPLD